MIQSEPIGPEKCDMDVPATLHNQVDLLLEFLVTHVNPQDAIQAIGSLKDRYAKYLEQQIQETQQREKFLKGTLEKLGS